MRQRGPPADRHGRGHGGGHQRNELFRQNHRLELNERVDDGFFDPGRGRPARPLAEWRSDPVVLTDREVLLVELEPLRQRIQNVPLMLALRTSVADKFKLLAQLVSSCFGNMTITEAAVDQRLADIKGKLNSNVIPLHELLFGPGVCRHRALLFKVLCDELSQQAEHGLQMRCCLVRGQQQGGYAHAWNEVTVFGETRVCDIMQNPGTFYRLGDSAAQAYQNMAGRAIYAAGANASIAAPVEHPVIGQHIGGGSYGAVYRGKWRGGAVIIKKVNPSSRDDRARTALLKEIDLLKQLRHPNIVLHMADSNNDTLPTRDLYLVLESMESDLFSCLHPSPPHPAQAMQFRWAQKGKRILLDAARGLLFLQMQSPAVIHYDIKSSNILIGFNGTAKLADIGSAKVLDQTLVTPGYGTPGYQAPESRTNEKSDIYSFGIVMWEVHTGRVPGSASQVAHWLRRAEIQGWESRLREILLGKPNGPVAARHCGAIDRVNLEEVTDDSGRTSTKPRMHPPARSRPSAVQVVQALE